MFLNYDDYEDGLSDFQQAAFNDAQRENDMEAAMSRWDTWSPEMFKKRPPTPQQCERWGITYNRGLKLWAEINDQPNDYKGKPQPRRTDFIHRREYMGARALWQLQNRPEEPSAPSSSFDDIPF